MISVEMVLRESSRVPLTRSTISTGPISTAQRNSIRSGPLGGAVNRSVSTL